MKLIRWLVTAALALVLIVFAVANRGTVALNFWPLPVAVEAPLYLIALVALLLGFLVGELVAWINGRHWRRKARALERKIAGLESELAAKMPAAAELKPPVKAIARD